MSKPGIRIVEESLGSGRVIGKHDGVRIKYDMQMSQGAFLIQDQWEMFSLRDRDIWAGLRYGIEGMREGGTRTFKASPHLCYGDKEFSFRVGKEYKRIPENAVLVFTIKSLKLVK